MDLSALKNWVKQGEHWELEFKRKANHPHKISKELVAFANTRGGALLIGVDDNGEVYGSKTATEDAFAIQHCVETYCLPKIPLNLEYVYVNSRRSVLVIRVKQSRRKPHFLLELGGGRKKTAFVRFEDKSVIASREMIQLMRMSRRQKGVSITYGEHERQLLQHFERRPKITLPEVMNLLDLSRRKASTLLILLVRAGLLRIHPTERGDYFTLEEAAFKDISS